jgi:GT2 family glycosyltransferase
MTNTEQLGFAENHAQALSLIGDYRYLIVFNDDAILENNAFSRMIETAENGQDVAIVGARIYDLDGKDAPSAAPFPGIKYFVQNTLGFDRKAGEKYPRLFMDYIDFNESQEVDWVSGCCMLIKNSFLDQHGFMDIGYYMFLEDTDICHRASRLGYKVMYASEAKIVHLGGGSSKVEVGQQARLMHPKLFLVTHKSRLKYLRERSGLQYVIYLIFIYLYLPLKIARVWGEGNTQWVSALLQEFRVRPLI